MTIVPEIARAMQAVLTAKADELGRTSGFIKRQRKWSGSQFVQALVFGWMAESDARLSSLRQSAANVKVQISRQGLDQRFSPQAAQFLEWVLYESIAQVIRTNPVNTTLLNRFEGVYVMDSTTLILPDSLSPIWQGCEGSAVKIGVCWELLSGELVEVHLCHAYEHDQKLPMQQRRLPAGAIRLADLGFYKLDVLQQLDLQQLDDDGSLWVTRYKGGTTLWNAQGQALDLLELLDRVESLDWAVYVGRQQLIRCRLIAVRVPPDKLAQRQAQLKRWESRKQQQASAERWALLAWSIHLTNAAPEQLSGQAVALMARVRWQIELLFKLWKDGIDIDDWRSTNPWRILCEVYAKLIACILQHWFLLAGDVHALDRSLTQACPAIRHLAWALAHALTDWQRLCDLLAHLKTILATSTRISPSASSPPTFQRIQRLDS